MIQIKAAARLSAAETKMQRFGNPKAKHYYEASVEKDGVRSTIGLDADTRTQAAKIAKDNGYTVRDMNMVG